MRFSALVVSMVAASSLLACRQSSSDRPSSASGSAVANPTKDQTAAADDGLALVRRRHHHRFFAPAKFQIHFDSANLCATLDPSNFVNPLTCNKLSTAQALSEPAVGTHHHFEFNQLSSTGDHLCLQAIHVSLFPYEIDTVMAATCSPTEPAQNFEYDNNTKSLRSVADNECLAAVNTPINGTSPIIMVLIPCDAANTSQHVTLPSL